MLDGAGSDGSRRKIVAKLAGGTRQTGFGPPCQSFFHWRSYALWGQEGCISTVVEYCDSP